MKNCTMIPLMALIALVAGLAHADAAKSASYGYVSDGLVAHWDALDNVATGVHDGTATTWVDLVSGVTVAITNGVVGTDFVQLNSPHLAQSDVLKFGWDEPVTVEVAVRATALPADYSTSGKTVFALNRRSEIAFDLREFKAHKTLSYGFQTYPRTPHQAQMAGELDYVTPLTGDVTPDLALTNALHHYAAATDFNRLASYYDGLKVGTSSMMYQKAYSSDETPDGSCTFGAALFLPRQYAVRVYNRQLTADEIAWNRMIDRHRYLGESLAALPRPALSVAAIPEQDWDGVHAFKPSVRVSNDILGETLTEGVHYEVGDATWMLDGTAPAAERAQVIVTGKGLYEGCRRVCTFAVRNSLRATVVRKGDRLVADIEFPAADEVRELYVAGADADAGGRMDDWGLSAKLENVPAGKTKLAGVAIPAEVASKPVLRFFIESADLSGYVQTGLVAHWDAIDNLATGVHDDTATTWVDRIGGATVTITNGSVGANFVQLNTAHKGQSAALAIGWNEPLTIEVLSRATALPANYMTAGAFFFAIDRRSGLAYDLRQFQQNRKKTNLYYTFPRTPTKGGIGELDYYHAIIDEDKPDVSVKDPHNYTVVTDFNSHKPYYDGSAVSTWAMQWQAAQSAVPDGTFTMGAKDFLPQLYAVRVYNRKLSDAEIARNAAVDSARFLKTGKCFRASNVVATGTVSVELNGRQATVSTAACGRDRRVLAAWGDADAGTSVMDWDDVEELGTLPANESTATYTVSKTFVSAPIKRILVSSATGSESYVKDGLILQYDGIDNVVVDGIRMHDAMPSVWNDLSGNGHDLVLPGWVVAEKRGLVSFGQAVKSAVTAKALDITPEMTVTIECVMNRRRWLNSKYTAVESVLATPLGQVFFRGSEANGLATFELNGEKVGLGTWTPGNMSVEDLHTLVIGLQNHGTPQPLFLALDGVGTTLASSWQNQNWSTYRPSNSSFFGNLNTDIGIAAIRVYSRQLTNDELAANAAVDRERFGGTTYTAYEASAAFLQSSRGLLILLR